jgi:methylmalonyl-CoA/ethylmalonyl-CoA epimerase
MKRIQKEVTPLKISQFGIVVKDREKSMQQIRSLLGITGPFRLLDLDQPEAIVHGKKTPCKAKLAFAQVGPIEIELIEPGEGESIWSEFLHAKGEGVQHLGIFVSDLNKELAKFMEMGVGVLQSGESEHVKFAYLDTEGIVGVVIELLQVK